MYWDAVQVESTGYLIIPLSPSGDAHDSKSEHHIDFNKHKEKLSTKFGEMVAAIARVAREHKRAETASWRQNRSS